MKLKKLLRKFDRTDSIHYTSHDGRTLNKTSQETSDGSDVVESVPFSSLNFWQPVKQVVPSLKGTEARALKKWEFAIFSKYMDHLYFFRLRSHIGAERADDSDFLQAETPINDDSFQRENVKAEIARQTTSAEGLEPKAMPQRLNIRQTVLELTDTFLSESDVYRHHRVHLRTIACSFVRQHWPALKRTCHAVAHHSEWRIRRIFAFSMHELAPVLGPKVSEEDLLPICISLLHDLDKVRIGILYNLYDFVKLLNKNARRALLGNLADFLHRDNVRDWRFRHLFAQKLIPLCALYESEDINKYISPIAMMLAVDSVDEVRRMAFKLVGTVFKCFNDREKLVGETLPMTDRFLEEIVSCFAYSRHWRRRQTFAYICDEVMHQKSFTAEKFNDALFPALLELASDRIPNIRIAVAKVLSKNTDYFVKSMMTVDFEAVLKTLADDCDDDVRTWATFKSHLCVSCKGVES
ncbi:unnamed protein product [Soboliphyme baturini]|uniref:Serine/threonine protein phosphatase 2A regulatory subunit n=1 Tax=Soboliphyme baturini TaxID=241478 RepID=A0A183J4B2_9BILA|nr:unnamed protein product [Soboliphyme baturini]